jgi:hypothetical protein
LLDLTLELVVASIPIRKPRGPMTGKKLEDLVTRMNRRLVITYIKSLKIWLQDVPCIL